MKKIFACAISAMLGLTACAAFAGCDRALGDAARAELTASLEEFSPAAMDMTMDLALSMALSGDVKDAPYTKSSTSTSMELRAANLKTPQRLTMDAFTYLASDYEKDGAKVDLGQGLPTYSLLFRRGTKQYTGTAEKKGKADFEGAISCFTKEGGSVLSLTYPEDPQDLGALEGMLGSLELGGLTEDPPQPKGFQTSSGYALEYDLEDSFDPEDFGLPENAKIQTLDAVIRVEFDGEKTPVALTENVEFSVSAKEDGVNVSVTLKMDARITFPAEVAFTDLTGMYADLGCAELPAAEYRHQKKTVGTHAFSDGTTLDLVCEYFLTVTEDRNAELTFLFENADPYVISVPLKTNLTEDEIEDLFYGYGKQGGSVFVYDPLDAAERPPVVIHDPRGDVVVSWASLLQEGGMLNEFYYRYTPSEGYRLDVTFCGMRFVETSDEHMPPVRL